MRIQDIQSATAAHYGICVSDLLSPRRDQIFTRPRHIAMFIAKNETGKSLAQIGAAFGGREHTTVRNALEGTQGRMDADTQRDIEEITTAAIGFVFRSVRAPQPTFKTTRTK